ncbi:bifunctional 3-phosphoshikimate 1-carboxyvinyltransferase/cytidylate kinase [Amphibiibacter pelophylacis]|uniref:Bifunctional 3-phosphoshikimate 1-carboxyvinyltransferase/cytidylate kinase n=1 Tax=Amphibiibacter pelophylacis TaxID=1799477 RepID=A0ACC6NYX3_9BURK
MYSIPALELPPLLSAAGTVVLPGSKSISNRILLLAGLSQGETAIRGLLDSDDTRVMLAALQQLGCAVVQDGDVCRVTGLGGPDARVTLAVPQAQLFLGNAGTAMRPLTAALAVLAAQQGGCFELSGIARMHERPIGDLVDALRELGCTVTCLGQEGYPPLRVAAAAGPFPARRQIRVRGDVSSQFLTALLLALPLLTAQGDMVIEVEGELISKPYIDITLGLLARFGISVQREGWSRFTLPQGSRYQSPGEIWVEGDASSASYFVALGAIAAVDAPLRIEGVGLDAIQGDVRFIDAARAMGADVQGEANALVVRRGAWPLKAVDMDCNHIPDAAMTLAVMALFTDPDGPATRLTGIASWRVKETDRIAAMATELRKVGARVTEGPDFIEVSAPLHAPESGPLPRIHTYDDHRMAMCLSLAALQGDSRGVVIEDPRCVGKTFPDYFETLFACTRPRGAVPVLAVDGPVASGKGTLAAQLAQGLGYRLLDSGALYRMTAWAALQRGVALDDEAALVAMLAGLDVAFEPQGVRVNGVSVGDELRSEAVGNAASKVAVLPGVRHALDGLQHSLRALPGLVADGRDMGTVVFPDARLKIFLTASAESRAGRRHAQLLQRGISSRINDLLADLRERDARDTQRATHPLVPAQDAVLLDNSDLTIAQTVDQVLQVWWSRA